MEEQDYKYLILTYQQKTIDFLSQIIASESRIRKLTDMVESLNSQILNQQSEIERLSQKPKRNSSAQEG